MRRIGSVKVCVGRKADGERKPIWEEVGSFLENEQGGQFVSLKRTFAPAGVPLNDSGSNIREVLCCVFPLEK